jgi:carbonic anhydrase/acetyltransferase-like protein (isoleucine patch superfamily)
MAIRGTVLTIGGKTPRFSAGVFVAETAAVTGDVELSEDVSIWYGAALRGDVGKIRVGARSSVQDNVTLHMSHGATDCVLGRECIIGHNAVIHGATLGDRVLVGMGAVVLDHVQIGDGSWIAAGSLVPARCVVPPNSLFLGGKVHRAIKDSEHAWARDNIERYVALAREYAAAR